MSVPFNAGEVFEIAQQMERNGARFYRRAAQSAADSHTRQLMLELAAMEDEHEQDFESMSAELSPEERQTPLYDPHDEAAQYLRAVAEGNVFDLKADPAEWLSDSHTAGDVLRMAIGLEKDSIVFYLGIKEAVPEKLGKGRIDDIIRQEMSHVSLLSARLTSVSQ